MLNKSGKIKNHVFSLIKNYAGMYNQDPFIHAKVVKLCRLAEGDMINFNVHVNSSQTPQVSAPVWIQCQKGTILMLVF